MSEPKLSRVVDFIGRSLWTAFLFTKSDIKTTIIPVTLSAAAASPLYSFNRLPHVVLWIWLHLLQCDVSNQYLDPEEDAANKSYRPLASRRISLRAAMWLRWLLVPACFGLSTLYSIKVLWASIALVAFTIMYNEFACHAKHWLIRNVLNAAGIASFEAGATLVSTSDFRTLDRVGIWSICLSFSVFATTIHSQDFKDRYGDSAIGRQTIPIVYPSMARYTVLLPLLVWSFVLSQVWELETLTTVLFMLLAAFVGFRYLMLETVRDDQVSFYWYNVSSVAVHYTFSACILQAIALTWPKERGIVVQKSKREEGNRNQERANH